MRTSTLSGQVAVVTGASSGIGLAAARELHALGLKLVLTARCEERLGWISDKLAAATVTADITEATVPDRLLATALERHGRCDVMINNAGAIEVGPMDSIDIDGVCSMVRVNVEAAYRVAYTFIRHFVKQGNGHVISMSSVMGTKVRPTAGAYAGTKIRGGSAFGGVAHGGRRDKGRGHLRRAGPCDDGASPQLARASDCRNESSTPPGARGRGPLHELRLDPAAQFANSPSHGSALGTPDLASRTHARRGGPTRCRN